MMHAASDHVFEAIPLPHRRDLSDADALEAATRFFELMKTRHTVRKFSDRPVPRAIIEAAIRTAGRAPSGANHQPWHFVAISDPGLKHRVRVAAELVEQKFYGGGAGQEWLDDLKAFGTDARKDHLSTAPWLIAVMAQRWGEETDGARQKNYYVPESVGIACGFLIAALHTAGLSVLTHTPNPMKEINALLGRPAAEKPVMILAVGHPADDATVPVAATVKKPLEDILTVHEHTDGND